MGNNFMLEIVKWLIERTMRKGKEKKTKQKESLFN